MRCPAANVEGIGAGRAVSVTSETQTTGRTQTDEGMIALALVVALGIAGSASAQAPDPADFVLRPGATELPPRVDELGRHLPRAGVDGVLAEANRPATPNGACSEPAFGTMPAGSRWYCFDPADSGDLERPDAVEWIPQGVTTSADAGSGRDALLVSWYDKRTAPAKGVRVSFLDAATNRYRHVLLVYPTADGSYEIVGRPQGGIHAGGIVWHGNRLYVVDTTRGIRVFDLRQIFDLGRSPAGDTADATKIGRHGDTYYGFGYRYVLPQVGAWVNAAGPDDDGDFACDVPAPAPLTGLTSPLSVARSDSDPLPSAMLGDAWVVSVACAGSTTVRSPWASHVPETGRLFASPL